MLRKIDYKIEQLGLLDIAADPVPFVLGVDEYSPPNHPDGTVHKIKDEADIKKL